MDDPVIELDGTNATGASAAIYLRGVSDSTVRGYRDLAAFGLLISFSHSCGLGIP